MTARSDFDDQEWEQISEAPVTAGMIVLTAEHGGTFRETWALSHAYVDARKEHGRASCSMTLRVASRSSTGTSSTPSRSCVTAG